MASNEKSVGMAVLAVIGSIALVPALAVMKAFVFVIIWGWFMVPLGAPKIGIAVAIGIMCIAGMLLSGNSSKESGKEWYEIVITSTVTWLLLLFVAWCAYQFV